MVAWWWHEGYMVVTWWLHDGCIMVIWWSHDGFMMVTWRLRGDCMMVTWWLHGVCMMITWWLHSGYMLVTRWLHGGYMVVAWSHDGHMIVAWWLHDGYERLHGSYTMVSLDGHVMIIYGATLLWRCDNSIPNPTPLISLVARTRRSPVRLHARTGAGDSTGILAPARCRRRRLKCRRSIGTGVGVVACWLHDVTWRLHGGYVMVAWWFHDGGIVVTWWLLESSIVVTCWLHQC